VGVADLVGVAEDRRAMGFGEPDRRAEVVDVRVGEQEGVDVVDAEPELATESRTSSRWPGNPASMMRRPVSSATRVQFTKSVCAKCTVSVIAVMAAMP
jgi:hypothetical protein